MRDIILATVLVLFGEGVIGYIVWPLLSKQTCDNLPAEGVYVERVQNGMNVWRIERFPADIYIACDNGIYPK